MQYLFEAGGIQKGSDFTSRSKEKHRENCHLGIKKGLSKHLKHMHIKWLIHVFKYFFVN